MMTIITLRHFISNYCYFRATLHYNDTARLPVYENGQKEYSVE